MQGENLWKKTDPPKSLGGVGGGRAGGDEDGVGWQAKVIKGGYSKKVPTGVLEGPNFIHRPDT